MFCFAHFLLNKLKKKPKETEQQVLLAQIDLYKSVSVSNGALSFILFFHFEGKRRFNRKIGEGNIVLFIHFSFLRAVVGTDGFCQDLYLKDVGFGAGEMTHQI